MCVSGIDFAPESIGNVPDIVYYLFRFLLYFTIERVLFIVYCYTVASLYAKYTNERKLYTGS